MEQPFRQFSIEPYWELIHFLVDVSFFVIFYGKTFKQLA